MHKRPLGYFTAWVLAGKDIKFDPDEKEPRLAAQTMKMAMMHEVLDGGRVDFVSRQAARLIAADSDDLSELVLLEVEANPGVDVKEEPASVS